ncbi:MAG: archease [Thermoplasmata archaeon]
MKFEIIEHTADVGICGYGNTPEEIFAAISTGMFSLIVDLKTVKEEIIEEFEVRAETLEDLAVLYLSELLFRHDTYRMLFARFQLAIENRNGSWILRAKAFGEKIHGHELNLLIKGVTYHMLEINLEKGYGTVIFDV